MGRTQGQSNGQPQHQETERQIIMNDLSAAKMEDKMKGIRTKERTRTTNLKADKTTDLKADRTTDLKADRTTDLKADRNADRTTTRIIDRTISEQP